MASRFTELVIDCHQPRALAAFWCAVLDYQVIDDKDDEVEIAGWQPTVDAVRRAVTAPTVLFVRVPESKTLKNRLHIDVSPFDRGHDEEVERVLALGARRVTTARRSADRTRPSRFAVVATRRQEGRQDRRYIGLARREESPPPAKLDVR